MKNVSKMSAQDLVFKLAELKEQMADDLKYRDEMERKYNSAEDKATASGRYDLSSATNDLIDSYYESLVEANEHLSLTKKELNSLLEQIKNMDLSKIRECVVLCQKKIEASQKRIADVEVRKRTRESKKDVRKLDRLIGVEKDIVNMTSWQLGIFNEALGKMIGAIENEAD